MHTCSSFANGIRTTSPAILVLISGTTLTMQADMTQTTTIVNEDCCIMTNNITAVNYQVKCLTD